MDSIKHYQVNFLVFLHIIATISLVFPYGFPLFPMIVVLFFIYALIAKDIFIRVNHFIILLYLAILVYLIGVYNSQGLLYNTVTKDLINTVSIVLLFFSL